MQVAVIGAGSHFTLALLRAAYRHGKSDNYHFRFMDIRPEPLEVLVKLMERFNRVTGRKFTCSTHQDRIEALKGADHILASFAVDFPDSFLRTCWVMQNHGINFVEGETATPGALMATMRHLPPLLEIANEIKQYANGAWLHIINNPMPRLVRGVIKGTGYTQVVGHCHGTRYVRQFLGELVDVPAEEIELFAAGINHFHLVQKAVDRRNGQNLLASLKSLSLEKQEYWREHNFTQWKMFEELGYFIGHGIWHNFDYLPYANQRLFIHSEQNTWYRYNLVAKGMRSAGNEIGHQLTTDVQIQEFLAEHDEEQMFDVMMALSGEIESHLYLSGNMPNEGKLPGFPDPCIIELPAMTTKANGIQLLESPEPLPLFFEGWIRQQINIHELSVRAVLEQSRQAAIEAIACDPSFRDCDCSPGQLLDEMMAVNKGLVPELR